MSNSSSAYFFHRFPPVFTKPRKWILVFLEDMPPPTVIAVVIFGNQYLQVFFRLYLLKVWSGSKKLSLVSVLVVALLSDRCFPAYPITWNPCPESLELDTGREVNLFLLLRLR